MAMSLSALYEGYVVPASTLLPIVSGFIWYKQLSKATHALVAYLTIALLINIAGIIMAAYHTNNLPLLHFYTLFELVAVMWYYKLAFADKKMDRWINIIMIVYPIICVVNFTFFQSLYKFNTYTRPLEAIIIIIFSSLYLSRQGDTHLKDPASTAGRWISSGFLLYLCGSLFQFIFSNVISHSASKPVKHFIWNLHATFVLIMYILFFIAIRHERGKR